jgi:hypothetical protein
MISRGVCSNTATVQLAADYFHHNDEDVMQALVTAGAFRGDRRRSASHRSTKVCSRNLTTAPSLSSTIAHSCSKTQTSSAGRSISVCKYFISRFAQDSGGIRQAQNSGSDNLIESTVCSNASAKAKTRNRARPSGFSQATDVRLEQRKNAPACLASQRQHP